MKAGVLTKNGTIEYKDVSMPALSHDMAMVRVKAAGICGSDIPRVFQNKAHHYPLILGHEFSGEIVEIGSKVSKLKVGDRIVGAPLLPCMKCDACKNGNYSLCHNYSFVGSRIDGAFAEYVALPEKNLVKISPDVDYTNAVFFEPSTVALHALLHAGGVKNANIAVIGCGTIGIFVIQWAKILGAKSVCAIDISSERLRLAIEMGADYTVDTTISDPIHASELLTKGRLFDLLIEAAGSVKTIKMSFSLIGNKGRICNIGTPKEEVCFPPDTFEQLNRKEFSLTGSWMSYSRPFPGIEWEMTSKHLADGTLKICDSFIFRKLPLSHVDEAFSLFLYPEQIKGKVILIND